MISPSKVVRIAAVVALVAGWLILRWLRPEWAQLLLTPWISLSADHGWWVPAVSGALLIAVLANFIWTVYGPRHSRRPDDAMALGCISMAAIGLAVVILVLAAGVVFKIHFLVNAIGFTTIILAIFIIPQLIWALAKDRRKKR